MDKKVWEVAIWKTYNKPKGPIFYDLNEVLASNIVTNKFLEGR